jgi:hypothetical protein
LVVDTIWDWEFGYFAAVWVVVDTDFKDIVVSAIIGEVGEVGDGDWELVELEGSDELGVIGPEVEGLVGRVLDLEVKGKLVRGVGGAIAG